VAHGRFPGKDALSTTMGPRIALDGNATCGRDGFRRRGLPPDSAVDWTTGSWSAPRTPLGAPRSYEGRD